MNGRSEVRNEVHSPEFRRAVSEAMSALNPGRLSGRNGDFAGVPATSVTIEAEDGSTLEPFTLGVHQLGVTGAYLVVRGNRINYLK